MISKNYLRWEASLIFVISLMIFLYGLFNREFVEFESRFAVFVQEMLHYGPSFFATTYGKPYPDYPGTQTFLIYLFALAMGKFNVLTAVLPSAIASAATLSLTYLIVAKVYHVWARYSVLMMLLTYQFFVAARGLTMDPFVVCATTWAFYVVFDPAATKLSFKTLLWLLLPLIFGFMIRGPIGLVIPAGVVLGCLILEKDWRGCFSFGITSFFLLAILFALLLLAALKEGGPSFVKDVIDMQVLGRMSVHVTQYQPFAYFTESFANYALSFELALLVIIINYKRIFSEIHTPAIRLIRAAILWAIIVMIGMSIPEVRKIRYIMPIVPALAILSSYLWVMPHELHGVQLSKKILNIFLLSLPGICLLLIFTLVLLNQLEHFSLTAHYFSAVFLLLILAAFSFYLGFKPTASTKQSLRQFQIVLLAFLSFAVLEIFVVIPIDVELNRASPFVQRVMLERGPNEQLAFLNVDADAEPIKFVAAYGQVIPIRFLTSISDQDQNLIYITKQSLFDELPESIKDRTKVIVEGKVGHRKMVAFKLDKNQVAEEAQQDQSIGAEVSG